MITCTAACAKIMLGRVGFEGIEIYIYIIYIYYTYSGEYYSPWGIPINQGVFKGRHRALNTAQLAKLINILFQ